jgi:hypothetical protein
MRVLLFAVLMSLQSAQGFAGYDDTWFKSGWWSGDYPPGFSVTKNGITLMARSGMDKDLPREVACEMPYLAVIHPGNEDRIRKSNMQFFSATKIIQMVAKEEFDFGDDVEVKKGEVIEYIGNGSEGDFAVRIGGKPYTADQSLWDFVDVPNKDQFIEDDWVQLTCQAGNRAYIFLDDVRVKGPNHTFTFVPGISDADTRERKVYDLTEREAAELENARVAMKAFTGYDDTWFKSKFWSGEYPPGFSVTKERTTLMARSRMDKGLPRDVACEMPYLAVIHPCNRERNLKNHIEFYSATKILKLVAKEDFKFDSKIPIKKGESIEYIGNGAEDYFGVRIGGKIYTAAEYLFQVVEAPARDEFIEDDWVLLTCQAGNRAYIYLDDVRIKGPNYSFTFASGISDGSSEDFGKARDLTEQEAMELEKKRGAPRK